MTTTGGADYVPPADRIATFDQDGTLWVEHPLYTQAMFALDRVHELAPKHPEWKTKEPFKAVLAGDREAMAKFSEGDWAEIIGATHAGMSTEEFLGIVREWLAKARHPRFGRPPTELIYQPMLEVMKYLRANGFRTYIVTGGGQEFVRVYSERVYDVPVEQVVGSSIVTKYEARNGKPVLMREPKVFFIDDKDWQGDRHQPVHRQAALRRLRQLGRRPRDAGVDRGGRRCAADDAGASRRRAARVRLRPRQRSAGYQGRHVLPGADGRGEEEGLDRHQHEERLEDDLSGGAVKATHRHLRDRGLPG